MPPSDTYLKVNPIKISSPCHEPGECGGEEQKSDEVASKFADVVARDIESAFALFVPHADDAPADHPEDDVGEHDGENSFCKARLLADEHARRQHGQACHASELNNRKLPRSLLGVGELVVVSVLVCHVV